MGHKTEKDVEAIALYPGCTLETSSVQFRDSLKYVLDSLNIPCPELEEWTCCGASSAHAIDPPLSLALAQRNLMLAEEQGYSSLLAPCAACYHRLASAELKFRQTEQILADCNKLTGLTYNGNTGVLNLLDLLANTVGTDRIRAQVQRPLSDLRVACYYGCLNTKIPGLDLYDDRECPVSMDLIVEAVGATALDWCCRTECCGGSLFVTAEEVSARLIAEIIRDAVLVGAECIVVTCPMCQNNLEVKQREICDRFGISRVVPVLFLTQLMGLAFGATNADVGLYRNVIPFLLENIRESFMVGSDG